MAANEKRHEELKHATAKLKALAEAMVLVHNDSTARELLEDALMTGTHDGTPTHEWDLHDLFLRLYGRSSSLTKKEEQAIADEQEARRGAAA